MSAPLIAIAGSANSRRTYMPELRNPDLADSVAEQLGHELAAQGFRIIVYSAEPDFIEASVVRGYIASHKLAPKSIVALFTGEYDGQFPEAKKHPEVFDLQHDQSNEWEISYFRSLADVDGIVLVGGGQSTVITGVLARTFRTPIVAVRHFGAAAEQVWKALDPHRDLCTDAEIKQMGQAPSAAAIKSWVDSLRSQLDRRQTAPTPAPRFPAQPFIALLLLLAWVLLIPVGLWLASSADPKGGLAEGAKVALNFLLFLAPVLAGGSAATLRLLAPDSKEEVSLRSVVFGMGAAAIVAVLYLAPQLSDAPSVTRLIWSIVYGFLGGLTADVVMSKLRQRNVVQEISATSGDGGSPKAKRPPVKRIPHAAV